MLRRVCNLLGFKPASFADADRNIILDQGNTVPTAATAGYAVGALFLHRDGGEGTALYVNEGTEESCAFNAVASLTAAQEALLGATAGTVAASKAVIPDAYKTLRWGGFNTGAALTDAVAFATVPDTWIDGQLDVFAVFGGTGSNLGSGYSAKCARFRHVVQFTTVAQETYGAVGQVVVRATTMTHLHAGLMGTFEGHTASVVLNSAYTNGGHAAVMARVGGHAAITATTPLAGFLAFNNASAALAAGSSIAFLANAYSASYPWTTGLSTPVGSVVTAIKVGAFAGSAVTTSGIPFSTAQDIYSDGQLSTVDLHGASASDLTSAYCAKVIRARHIVNVGTGNLAHETYGVMGQVVVKATTLQHLHAGVIGTFEGHTSGVVVNSSYTFGACGVMARVGGGAAITGTTKVAGMVSFLNGADLASGVSVAFGACDQGTAEWQVGLEVSRATALFGVPAAGTHPVTSAATAFSGLTSEGYITINVGGAAKKLYYVA